VGAARAWAAPPHGVGSLWPPAGSRSVFDPLPGKIRLLELVSSNFENIFLCSISETQKQQKTGNWHYGILSIG
jgi:hypothetical protein